MRRIPRNSVDGVRRNISRLTAGLNPTSQGNRFIKKQKHAILVSGGVVVKLLITLDYVIFILIT